MPPREHIMNPGDLLVHYLKAYEAKDLPTIETLLADQVRLQDWNLTALGKAAVLAETEKNFNGAKHLRIDILRVYAIGRHAAAELRILVNETIELNVVDVISLDEQGKVDAIRAYKG